MNFFHLPLPFSVAVPCLVSKGLYSKTLFLSVSLHPSAIADQLPFTTRQQLTQLSLPLELLTHKRISHTAWTTLPCSLWTRYTLFLALAQQTSCSAIDRLDSTQLFAPPSWAAAARGHTPDPMSQLWSILPVSPTDARTWQSNTQVTLPLVLCAYFNKNNFKSRGTSKGMVLITTETIKQPLRVTTAADPVAQRRQPQGSPARRGQRGSAFLTPIALTGLRHLSRAVPTLPRCSQRGSAPYLHSSPRWTEPPAAARATAGLPRCPSSRARHTAASGCGEAGPPGQRGFPAATELSALPPLPFSAPEHSRDGQHPGGEGQAPTPEKALAASPGREELRAAAPAEAARLAPCTRGAVGIARPAPPLPGSSVLAQLLACCRSAASAARAEGIVTALGAAAREAAGWGRKALCAQPTRRLLRWRKQRKAICTRFSSCNQPVSESKHFKWDLLS